MMSLNYKERAEDAYNLSTARPGEQPDLMGVARSHTTILNGVNSKAARIRLSVLMTMLNVGN
jgi:hypothetical protein